MSAKQSRKAAPRRKAPAPSPRADEDRYDGFASDLLGIGNTYDKAQSFTFRRVAPLTAQAAMDLFHGNDIAARACSALPDNAMRGGFDLVFHEDKTNQLASEILSELRDLETHEKIVDYASFARACGGAGLLMGAVDGIDPREPLNVAGVTDLEFLNGYDRRELDIQATYANRSAPNYGRPARYRLMPAQVVNGYTPTQRTRQLTPKEKAAREALPVVHESRMLMFGGARTARAERALNRGWDHSILDRLRVPLQQAEVAWAAIGNLTLDSSQGVWKMPLRQQTSEGRREYIEKRIRAVERGRSIARAVILGPDEEFTRVPTQFAGLVDIAREAWVRLAAAADMPVTVLMGISPAGLNATGESDIKLWYDRVAAYRRLVLAPMLERLVTLLLAKRGLAAMKRWEIVWPSLWLTSPLEEAQRRSTIAATDAVYIGNKVVLPEEVTLSRFRSEGWNPEMQVDLEAREKMRKAAVDRAVAEAQNPTPGATPPTAPTVNPATVERLLAKRAAAEANAA